jgi:hypothetical protein
VERCAHAGNPALNMSAFAAMGRKSLMSMSRCGRPAMLHVPRHHRCG